MIFSICFDLTGILNHKLSPFKRCNISTVGLQKILSLLEAEDPDVRIHAVKVVANLAAEGTFLFLSSCFNPDFDLCAYAFSGHKRSYLCKIYCLTFYPFQNTLPKMILEE